MHLYLRDMALYTVVNDVYKEFCKANPPTRYETILSFLRHFLEISTIVIELCAFQQVSCLKFLNDRCTQKACVNSKQCHESQGGRLLY